jgi:hypothetical protein
LEDEYPPEDPERFRQKAREHKRDAIAALTASSTLKAVLNHGRTRKDQIRLMQHYVLEFGQAQSRNARLSNSLADDDPRKEKVDQDGFTETFVVSTLNEILGEVASQSSGQVQMQPLVSNAQPTMAGRLGQVLSWTANLIVALAILTLFLVIAANENNPNYAGTAILVGVVVAAVVWAIGRGVRYVLAGS